MLWPPGVVKRATRAPARRARTAKSVARAVQDRHGLVAQLHHRLAGRGPRGQCADGGDLGVAPGLERGPAAHRVPDQHDRYVLAQVGPQLLDRPVDVLVGVGGLAVPPGHPVAHQGGLDPAPAEVVADEAFEGPHAHQRQRAVLRRGLARGGAAVAEQGDPAGLAVDGVAFELGVGHGHRSIVGRNRFGCTPKGDRLPGGLCDPRRAAEERS
jgi:hypothetical protein